MFCDDVYALKKVTLLYTRKKRTRTTMICLNCLCNRSKSNDQQKKSQKIATLRRRKTLTGSPKNRTTHQISKVPDVESMIIIAAWPIVDYTFRQHLTNCDYNNTIIQVQWAATELIDDIQPLRNSQSATIMKQNRNFM